MRIAAILEYDGSNFSGWQRQAQARSVQQAVEEAASEGTDQPLQAAGARHPGAELDPAAPWHPRLAVARMQNGAGHLIGEHDFTSFRAAECQEKSPVRALRALEVTRHGELVHIRAAANAFLQHMVRNIAGVLMTIGAGEKEPAWAP